MQRHRGFKKWKSILIFNSVKSMLVVLMKEFLVITENNYKNVNKLQSLSVRCSCYTSEFFFSLKKSGYFLHTFS